MHFAVYGTHTKVHRRYSDLSDKVVGSTRRQNNRLPGLLALKMLWSQIILTNRLAHESTTPTNKRWHLSGSPLRGGCTPTPNGVGPNLPHLSFCSAPFSLEQRPLGIALAPQGTKQFVALNGDRTCSARQAEARQQQQAVAMTNLSRILQT